MMEQLEKFDTTNDKSSVLKKPKNLIADLPELSEQQKVKSGNILSPKFGKLNLQIGKNSSPSEF